MKGLDPGHTFTLSGLTGKDSGNELEHCMTRHVSKPQLCDFCLKITGKPCKTRLK